METDNMATAADTPHHELRLLDALPAELLFRIARHLSTTEYCALRLSCRTVERALYQPFSREFFTRKQFMMSTFSLQALVDIAQHPYLSERLEHVSFGLDCLRIGVPSAANHRRNYLAAVSDQSTMFLSGRAVEMLTEAFSRLRNLKTVSIRDHNSRTRFRDFNSGHEYWTSHGFPTLRMNTGGGGEGITRIPLSELLGNTFTAVSTALAKSGARPKNFEMLLQRIRNAMVDEYFWIPPRPHDQDIARRMLSGLCKLHLRITLSLGSDVSLQLYRGNDRVHANPPVHSDDGLMAGINCNRYIAHTAPSLEWLRLNILWPTSTVEGVNNFMTYFTNPTNSKNPGDRIVYPKLKRLDLGHAHVTPSSLCSMLEGLPSVEILSLFHIGFVSTRGPIQIVWQTFLQKLPVLLPKLKRVDIKGPWEEIDRGIYDVVLENASDEFSIQVGAGENALDECAKVAAKLKYRVDPT